CRGDAHPHLVLPSLPTRRSSDLQEVRHVIQHYEVSVLSAIRVLRISLKYDERTPRYIPFCWRNEHELGDGERDGGNEQQEPPPTDRKSTRLNSSHVKISYAVFCM